MPHLRIPRRSKNRRFPSLFTRFLDRRYRSMRRCCISSPLRQRPLVSFHSSTMPMLQPNNESKGPYFRRHFNFDDADMHRLVSTRDETGDTMVAMTP